MKETTAKPKQVFTSPQLGCPKCKHTTIRKRSDGSYSCPKCKFEWEIKLPEPDTIKGRIAVIQANRKEENERKIRELHNSY